MVKNTKDNNFFLLNQAEKAIDDCKFIFGDLNTWKESGDSDLISVHYSRVLNSYLFKNENSYKNSNDIVDKYITRLNSDCTSLGLYLDIEFLVNHPIDKKKAILNNFLKKTLKYFTLNQLTKDVVDTIFLEADKDDLQFIVRKRTDRSIDLEDDEFERAILESGNRFLQSMRDYSDCEDYRLYHYLNLLSKSERFEKNNLFIDTDYLDWVRNNSIKNFEYEISKTIITPQSYYPTDWLDYENGIKNLPKDYIRDNILKPEYASKLQLDYGLVQLIYKYHGFECAPDEFWKNFQTKRQHTFIHDFYYANSENKDDFVYLIVDIENEFGVKKQVDLDTVEFRELSKAKSKNSRTKFMIGLVKATDTLIQLESKKFFDLIEGTNRLFDFISEFYTAIIDYDSLIVKDENYDKIIKTIEALLKLK